MFALFFLLDPSRNASQSATSAVTIIGIPWLIFYAWQTRLIVEEVKATARSSETQSKAANELAHTSRQQLELMARPLLDLQVRSMGAGGLEFEVKNFGTGTAVNVNYRWAEEEAGDVKPMNPIPPGQQARGTLIFSPVLRSKSSDTWTIALSYADMLGQGHNESFVIQNRSS